MAFLENRYRPSFPPKRESIFAFHDECQSRIKMDSRLRGNDGNILNGAR